MTKRKLTDHEWADIRSAYEGEEPNISALARQYGVSRALLHHRACADGWVKGGTAVPDKARSPARAPTSVPDRGAAEESETGFSRAIQTRVLLHHQRECDRLGKLISAEADALFAALGHCGPPNRSRSKEQDDPSPLARARLAKARIDNLQGLAQVLASKQKSEREAYRIGPKMVPEPEREPALAEQRARVAFSNALLGLIKAAKQSGVDLEQFSDIRLFFASATRSPS